LPDVKISAGADPVTLVGTDKVPVARSASTTAYAATMTEVAAFAATGLLSRSGGTMTGALVLAADPAAPLQAATKQYVDGSAPVGGPYVSIANLHDVGRNYIHNSMMAVAQRGAGPWSTFGTYTLDRWMTGGATDTVAFAQQSLADGFRAQLGDEEAAFALRNTFTGSAAAGACNYIAQKIENMRRLAGKTVTVSFWALCSAGTLKLGANFYQVFGTGGSPTGQVNINGQSVTINTVFTRYSLTFTLPSVSGLTLGTNNDHYTMLNFWFSSGATNNALAGNIGVQSGQVWIWGTQLELGPTATPLEKLDPQQDLAKAQRFYCTFAVNVPAVANASNLVFPVTMRGNPIVAGGGAGFATSNLSAAAVTISQTTAAAQTLTFSSDL
jgi:hypothetical protein